MSTRHRERGIVTDHQHERPEVQTPSHSGEFPFDEKWNDLYQTLIATRNFEIGLFWQRTNYFLVLNSGLAFGFFKLEGERYSLVFGAVGFLTSALWFWTSLGSKFWQTRWEQRLKEFEAEHFPGLDFFAASPERIRTDVRTGLSFHRIGWPQSAIYKLALDQKPSVSYAMILLSLVFCVGWAAFVFVKSVGA